ncbi:TIGR02611 family protein [Mycobacterium sp. smrl_JER01]|uniref:TIGR02611 family protein n=1 Tax=Mycobacterium sp. smrl_JER01 TaxID=3402633 RepID=UPI003ACF66FC
MSEETERLGFARRWSRWRDRLRERRLVNLTYRMTVGVVGLLVLVVGIVAIPYPGPGWAIVFVGLAILATEFDWARRLLAYVRIRYDAAMGWFKRQGLWVQVLGALFTFAVVVVTLWLFGVLGFMGGLLGLDYGWLDSPVGIGT